MNQTQTAAPTAPTFTQLFADGASFLLDEFDAFEIPAFAEYVRSEAEAQS